MTIPLHCLPLLEWPCLNADIWSASAAWVQAVLSALAILSAAWISSGQHRRDVRKQISALTTLMNLAAAAAINATRATEMMVAGDSEERIDVDVIVAVDAAMRAVPLSSVPDARLILQITSALRFSKMIVESAQLINAASGKGIAIPPVAVSGMNSATTNLRRHAREAERIEYDYRSALHRLFVRRPKKVT